jgi:SsrA-binding protein
MKKIPNKDIARNKKAFFEYNLFDRIEAGIELKGPEVKSIRQGKIALSDSFVRIENGQAYVYGMHISPYSQSGQYAPDPKRTRKLLLHKRQIDGLSGLALQKGHTLIPVRVYLKKGFVKIEIAVAKGKKLFDKREKLRQQTIDREIKRSIG